MLYYSQSLLGDFSDVQILHAPIRLSQTSGDFNVNGVLDAPDLDELTRQSSGGLNSPAYDLTDDALVNTEDVHAWVKDLFHTWIGDTDLDGEFNSSDLVSVRASGTLRGGHGCRLVEREISTATDARIQGTLSRPGRRRLRARTASRVERRAGTGRGSAAGAGDCWG